MNVKASVETHNMFHAKISLSNCVSRAYYQNGCGKVDVRRPHKQETPQTCSCVCELTAPDSGSTRSQSVTPEPPPTGAEL